MRVLANRRDGFEDLRRCDARFDSALRGQLINQAIRQRVAKRHTEFQNVHARLVEGERQLARDLEVRVACADVNDQSLGVLLSQPGKPFHDAIHARAHFPIASGRLQVASWRAAF